MIPAFRAARQYEYCTEDSGTKDIILSIFDFRKCFQEIESRLLADELLPFGGIEISFRFKGKRTPVAGIPQYLQAAFDIHFAFSQHDAPVPLTSFR